MKILLAALLGAIALFPAPGQAQERPGCFMVRPNGAVVDLSSICSPAAPVATAETSAPKRDPEQAAIAYASAYCDARRDDYPRDVSRRRAIAQYVGFGGTTADADLELALKRTGELCPGL